ncbi:hypothetical protein [Flavobacterium gilvum]|uniref:Uncharacterized protein n=1 Tax=Flavobacterium gilvum TaxID=1492737 RepID=A0AAC9I4L3_9FLAO|nr:hypothetical protein [Flavobacterium gilvum]AOW09276.1 hypothetical protein EM308_07010 [Flavobacterium gilvum]KFC59518.1 hypothetical protein FEM08_16650 [Flavobacterium gilvum]
MTPKKALIFLFLLIINLSYSQEKETSKIIKKDIKTNSGKDIIDLNDSSVQSALATKNYGKKNFVYYNGKFFPADTINKIENLKSFTIEIIKIPNTITKDIQTIIYLKKAAI